MLAQPPVVRLGPRQAGAVDAALLACPHADGLAVLHVADGVGLGVFQGDEGHQHVGFGGVGEGVVFRDDAGEKVRADFVLVPALLEGDAEHVLVLLGGGDVGRVDLNHVVAALLLGLQNLQGLRRIAGGDDAVGDLGLEVVRRRRVAHVGEGRPVAVGAQAVRPPGPDIGAGDGGELRLRLHEVEPSVRLAEGQAHGGPGGGDMLEAGGGGNSSGGLLQLPGQLPGVQGVQKVDIAGLAVQDGEGQVPAVLHEDAGGLLVGVAAVFQFQLVHGPRSFVCVLGAPRQSSVSSKGSGRNFPSSRTKAL